MYQLKNFFSKPGIVPGLLIVLVICAIIFGHFHAKKEGKLLNSSGVRALRAQIIDSMKTNYYKARIDSLQKVILQKDSSLQMTKKDLIKTQEKNETLYFNYNNSINGAGKRPKL